MKELALFLTLSFLLTGQPVERPRILGVAHVSVFVSNLEQARAFYKHYLGFDEIAIKRRPGGPEMMAIIKVNDSQYIEITAEKPKLDGQLKHIALYTDDIKGMLAYLGSQGAKVPGEVKKDRLGNAIFTIKDPDAHTIEFVQYMPGSMSAQQKGRLMPARRLATHISHVGVLVRDTENAQKFYKGILGFQGSGTKLRVPDGEDLVELGLNRNDPTPDRLNIKNHMCLEAPDVLKVVAALKAKPASKTYREIETHETNGRQVANLYDPDGSRIEFMEPKPAGGRAASSSPEALKKSKEK